MRRGTVSLVELGCSRVRFGLTKPHDMATITTKYDKGDEVYTAYGNDILNLHAALRKIKIIDIGVRKGKIVYFYEGAEGHYKEFGVDEDEILGNVLETTSFIVSECNNLVVKAEKTKVARLLELSKIDIGEDQDGQRF
jgi:hypothetical protein